LPILLALQAAAAAAAPAAAPTVPQRFSILAPAATGPCRPRGPGGPDDDILVCAAADPLRLPLPAERGPPGRPVASNPNLDGLGAMAAGADPCAARQGGCQVGVDILGMGTAAVRLVQKLVAPESCCEDSGEATNPFRLVADAVNGTRKAARGKPDKSNRVAIDLSDPPPPPPVR